MTAPHWLPDVISVSGDWDETLLTLYSVFDADFKQGTRRLKGRPVWWDRTVLAGEKYEEGFWHLISRDDRVAGDRLFDPRRAERLPWCGPTLSHETESEVKCWNYQEGSGHIRTYVWLEGFDYVVVLEKSHKRLGDVYFMITAYHVDGPSVRNSLTRKFDNREP